MNVDMKAKRELRAKRHTQLMEDLYVEDIKRSVSGSKVYTFDSIKSIEDGAGDVSIKVIDTNTQSAIQMSDMWGRLGVLNFASYKKPGGRFIDGSYAQEEALCHSSNLYNVLYRCSGYYEWNNKNLNNGLYRDRLLYTPNIKFNFPNVSDTEERFADVFTCALPNWGAAEKHNVLPAKNVEHIFKRVLMLLYAASENRIDTLILGAWGCGVFKQNPYVVANAFKDCLTKYKFYTKKFVFAIPVSERDKNYEVFNSVFEGIAE